MKITIKDACIALAIALLIDAALSESDSASLLFALLVFAPLLFIGISLALMLDYAKGKFMKNKHDESVIEALRKISYYKQRGVPFLCALATELKSEDNKEVARELEMLEKSLMLNKDADMHILQLETGAEDLEMAIQYIDMANERKMAATEGTIQTYATVNMFISIILPAFAVFGFVGSAILASSVVSFTVLSMVLLAGLPLAYTFGNVLLNSRLYG